jgi:hypothetical protein
MLTCVPPAYATTIYNSIYKCEGGREGSSGGVATYQGFLCTNVVENQYTATNSDTRPTDVLTAQLVDVEARMEQLRGNLDFRDRMTQEQLSRERDSLTQQLQAYREINH